MIPLYGFLEGDTLGLLVLARTEDTVAALAAQLERSASVRVRPRGRSIVMFKGERLDPRATLEQTGLRALDRFDVVYADGEAV
jgi:hypothetical protein